MSTALLKTSFVRNDDIDYKYILYVCVRTDIDSKAQIDVFSKSVIFILSPKTNTQAPKES